MLITRFMLHLRKVQGENVPEITSQFAPETCLFNLRVPELPTTSQPEIDIARRPSWSAKTPAYMVDGMGASALSGESSIDQVPPAVAAAPHLKVVT